MLATASHDEHVNNAAVLGTNYGCVDCHNTVVSANTTLSTGRLALHVDGSKHVGFAAQERPDERRVRGAELREQLLPLERA